MLLDCSFCGASYRTDPMICQSCHLLNTLRPREAPPPPPTKRAALSCGMEEIDRELLHGGLAPGVVLLAGEPGIGKSTLVSQWIACCGGAYLTTEESVDQVTDRIERVRSGRGPRAIVRHCTDLAATIASLGDQPLFVVDSINGLGGVSHAKALALVHALMIHAQALSRPVIALSHVNKEGQIAGLKSLEHAVNVAMVFEGDRSATGRRLSVPKSRLGPTAGRAVDLTMTARGLIEGSSIAALIEQRGNAPRVGSVLCPADGMRGIQLVEIDALVKRGAGRITVAGIDAARARRVVETVGDVFGLSEILDARNVILDCVPPSPSSNVTDAAIALAVLSSLREADLGPLVCAWGSLTLTGHVRGDALDTDRDRRASMIEGGVVCGPSDYPTLRALGKLVGFPGAGVLPEMGHEDTSARPARTAGLFE